MSFFESGYKSVLNTDSFDRALYAHLRKDSQKISELEKTGSAQLPTFPDLMGDIWSGLYKNTPCIKEEVPEEVQPNKPIMETVFSHQEFIGLREHTKLDELASALGLLHMGNHIQDFLKDKLPEELKKQAQELANMQQQVNRLRSTAEALNDILGPDGTVTDQKKAELQKRLAKVNRQMKKAEKQTEQLAGQLTQEIGNFLTSTDGENALGEVLKQAQQGVKEDTQALQSFFGGYSSGEYTGDKLQIKPDLAISLAEKIRTMDKLKKISELAGRMKKIAQKKQKSKTKDTVDMTDVTLGNNPGHLLPQELLLLSRSETRLDFLRRFGEEKLLQYSPGSKETLGKGPVVVLLDTSGSMKKLDSESKAIMLALMGIAKKQNRAFALINFASSNQQKQWIFPSLKNINPQTIIEMVEHFFSGNTDFENPLTQAQKVINQSKFKRGDLVFITDGHASISDSWLEQFLQHKKSKQFQVISVQLGSASTKTLERFSDKVINAKSLFDDAVANTVLAI